jgi:hypothetical protein
MSTFCWEKWSTFRPIGLGVEKKLMMMSIISAAQKPFIGRNLQKNGKLVLKLFFMGARRS